MAEDWSSFLNLFAHRYTEFQPGSVKGEGRNMNIGDDAVRRVGRKTVVVRNEEGLMI